MSFTLRPPSIAWEPAALAEAPGWPLWVWFRPADAPDGVLIQIPAPTAQACAALLTLRRLALAAGVPAEQVVAWSLHGMTFDSAAGTNPLLDQPVPIHSPQGETILVRVSPPSFGLPRMAPETASRSAASVYDAIDADWLSIQQLEVQTAMLRNQLNAMHTKLLSLNRDLSPEERTAADSADKREWQDTRRWLRDAQAHVSRCLRDHDLGSTSAAGNRNRFEQMHAEVVAPRRPVQNLSAVQKEFEVYRKTLQSLLSAMQNALSSAARDGEQRAQQLLTRIAAKVRNARTKK